MEGNSAKWAQGSDALSCAIRNGKIGRDLQSKEMAYPAHAGAGNAPQKAFPKTAEFGEYTTESMLGALDDYQKKAGRRHWKVNGRWLSKAGGWQVEVNQWSLEATGRSSERDTCVNRHDWCGSIDRPCAR